MSSPHSKRIHRVVIGLDSSTTSTKAIAFDAHGEIAAEAHEPIPLFSPEPGFYEQNPDDWWSSARKALRRIARQIHPERIDAIAIANQRETFVPLDRVAKCLRPAILWLDERCKDEVGPFSRKVGARKIHRITGKPVDYAPVVYRLAWMKNHEPSLFRNIGTVCDVQSFLVWRLTGSFKTSWASADPLGLFDVEKKKWSSTILSALGLHERQLPEVHCPGEIIGTLSNDAAQLTGLRPGTVIVAGGGDGQAAGTGANVLTSERAYLNLGTAVVAGVYGTRYRTSKAFRTMCSCSESGYYYECSLRAGTFAIDWFIRKVLGIDPEKQGGIYRGLESEARLIPAGSGGLLFLPYLCGVMNPYWDTRARGAFVGLSSSHSRGHMYRAILEGIAFEQLLALNAVEREIGRGVKNLVVIGGGAANRLWCRIFADITGRSISLPGKTEASALGAAIAAAVGAGWFGTFREAAATMRGRDVVMLPERRNLDVYRRIFPLYRSLFPALRKVVAGG